MDRKTFLLIAGLGIAGGLLAVPKKAYSQEFDTFFKKYANNPRLAKAIAIVESNLNPNALGDDGRAFGLMQIWYSTAQGHGYAGSPSGLFNPEANIFYATRELNYLVDAYGFDRGVMGYNIGETRLRKGGSNTEYLSKVLKYYGGVTV